jgi:hypothetical protein
LGGLGEVRAGVGAVGEATAGPSTAFGADAELRSG